MAADPSAPPPEPSPLGEVALLFLRLGFTAFGGPAAHIAIMEAEVVRRRRWLTPERFLDLLGAANLIPGPSSSELALYIGHERAGLPGLLVAGACFILPATLMTGGIAWAYVRFGALPQVGGALYGIKPVIIAVVLQALRGLGPRAMKSRLLVALGATAAVAAALGAQPLAVLVGAGAAAMLARQWRDGGKEKTPAVAPLLTSATAAVGATAVPVSLLGLFLVFVKIGAVVFGSGYVLLAFLRADLVDRLHWLTEPQLLDAVAVGQITPGPVFTTATFIGYLVGGVPGAGLATVGIFLPGFVLVASSRPILARVRRSPPAGAFLDGVNVASLALMAIVTWQLGRAAVVDGTTAALALASAVLLLRFQVSPSWLILGGGAVGLVAALVR
jgi:chromate transporter